MSSYLGKVHGAPLDFNELLPPAETSAQELEQCNTFLMLLALYGLPPQYSTNCDNMLGLPTVPTLAMAWSTLLQFSAKQSSDLVMAPTSVDTFALVYQSKSCGHSRNGNLGKAHPNHLS